jgi:hypothetical protein
MPVERLYAIDGYLRGRDGDQPFDDTFVLGETEPTALNAFTPAASCGPRVPETSMTNYAGSLTNVSANAVLERMIITGWVKPSVANWTLRDSIVQIGEPGTAGANPITRNLITPGLDTRASANVNITYEHVEVRPSFHSHEIYGFKGGNGTLYRSIVRGTVDGVQAHGQSATGIQKRVEIIGSLIEDLRIFEDPTQNDDITHNDGVQGFGALTLLRVRGSAIHGGRTSCILVQQQSGTYGDVEILENWLYGHASLGSTINTSQNGRGVIASGGHFWIRDNRILKAARLNGYCPISPSTIASAGFSWTGNTYMEDSTTANYSSGSD